MNNLTNCIFGLSSGPAYIEPPVNSRDLGVELCPNNTTLKLSWRMKKVQGLVLLIQFIIIMVNVKNEKDDDC